jgi:hypothetical protein
VLTVYESKRTALLTNAFESGGVQAMADLEEQYRRLDAVRYELILKKLDRNNPTYEEAREGALKATTDAENAIDTLQATSDILNAMAKVVTLVSTLLIVFRM